MSTKKKTKLLVILTLTWLWLLHLDNLRSPWPPQVNLDDCELIGTEASGFIPRHPAYMGDSGGHLLFACPGGVIRTNKGGKE